MHGIIKPADWTTSDFLFEAFYNNSSFKVINDQKDNISRLLNSVFADSMNIVASSPLSNKSTKLFGFKPNFGHIRLILDRSLREVFSRRIFHINTAMCLIFIFLFILLKREFFYAPLTDLFTTIFDACFAGLPVSPEITMHKEVIHGAIAESSTSSAIYDSLSHICVFVQNYLPQVAYLGCNIWSTLLVSNIFMNIHLVEKEMAFHHFSPMSFIMAALATEIVTSICTGVFICTGLLFTGVVVRLYFLMLLKIFVCHVLLSLSITLINTVALAMPVPLTLKEIVKGMFLYMVVNLYPYFGGLIKSAEALNTFLAIPARVLFGLIDFMFPSILFSNYCHQLVQAEYNKVAVVLFERVKYAEFNTSLKFISDVNTILTQPLADNATFIFPAQLPVLAILITSAIVIPLASLAIFSYRFAQRVSLNP